MQPTLSRVARANPYWIESLFRNGSPKKVNKFVNFVFGVPESERERVIEALITDIAAGLRKYGDQYRAYGIGQLAQTFTSRSLECRDYSFLNVTYSMETATPLSAYDLVRLELLLAMFTCVGSTLDLTKQFCRMLFADYAEAMTPSLALGREAARRFAAECTPLCAAIVWEAAHCPVNALYPYKQWLVNLIDASCSGDAEVDQWLECMIHLLQLPTKQLDVIVQTVFEELLKAHHMTEDDYAQTRFDPQHPKLIIPDDRKLKLAQFFEQMNTRRATARGLAQEWCLWFNADRHHFLEVMVAKRNAIRNDFVRFVRQDGYDSVDVCHVGACRDLGIERVTFYPTGSTWPDMDVEFTVRRMGCIQVPVRVSLVNLSLVGGNALLETCPADEHELRQVILEFIVVEILYRITVADRQDSAFLPKNHNGSAASNGSNGRPDVTIRDYMPHLPAGKQISSRAEVSCIKRYGFKPPEGRTYNPGHTPNGDAAAPTAKRIRYVLSDRLIQEGVGASPTIS